MVLQEMVKEENGLERLVSLIRRGTTFTTLKPWLESAYLQLEMDDSIDCEKSDQLALLLETAQEQIESETCPKNTLRALAEVYLAEPSVEEFWNSRAQALTADELASETWLELQAAVKATRDGRGQESTKAWVQETLSFYGQVWSSYEATPILESEITRESAVGHHCLLQGFQCWVDALEGLSAALEGEELDLDEISQLAEQGQRLLIVVQVMEEENRSNLDFYFGYWN